jgi:predicted aspartyl protease
MAWKKVVLACSLVMMAVALGTVVSASNTGAATTSTASCAKPRTIGSGGAHIPLSVIDTGEGPEFTVEGCIQGKGPFSFVVDSGADQSTITPTIAMRLKLPSAGRRQQTSGAGCSAIATPRRIGNWSIGGVALDSGVVQTQRISGLGGVNQPIGLLGADVLSRFGAVQFDFESSELTLPGPEGPDLTKTSEFQGPTNTPIPGDLITGSPHVVPLAVEMGPGFATAVAPVKIGTLTGSFLVDTGSSRSLVTPGFARKAKLLSTGKHESEQTACGTAAMSILASGPWSAGGTSLSRGPIDSADLPDGIEGLLGADRLSRFGSVVLSFRSAELLVSPR